MRAVLLGLLLVTGVAVGVSCVEEPYPVCGDDLCEPGEQSCPECQPPGDGNQTSKATVVVKNVSSSSYIHYFYARVCGSTGWGADRLGAGVVIAPSEERWFEADPGCWDLRMVTGDERWAEHHDLWLERGDIFTWSLTH